MKAKEIIEATIPYTLRPKAENRAQVIAAALRFVVNAYSYTHLYVDGDHGLGVVNVKDINALIEELESMTYG